MQVRSLGTATRATLTVGVGDLALSVGDAFGSQAYQDTIGTSVEVAGTAVHGVIGLGLGLVAAADGAHPAHQTALANVACGEFLKAAGYGAQAIGHPLIGLSLTAVGALQTILGGAVCDHADQNNIR